MIYTVYSSSDKFAPIAGVSILSMCENSKDPGNITFYMIDNGISEPNREKLRRITDSYGSRILFLDPPDLESASGTKISAGRWNISTFYRLFLPSILPKHVKKVLFIDCDTIVRHDLTGLWEMDMNGKWLFGVDDCRGAAYRTDIGLKEEDRYINNGVLLIDIEAWRKNKVEQMFIDFIKRYDGDITYVDQGVQNGVLSKLDKTGYIHPKYNCLTIFFAFDYDTLMKLRKPPKAMDRQQYKEAVNDPYIVHFQSCFRMGIRPWVKGCRHPFAPEYRMYREKTPWGNDPLMPDDRTIPQRALGAVTDIVPEKLMMGAVSFAHTRLYPAARSLKKRKKR